MQGAATARFQTRLDQLQREHGFAGATAAFVLAGGELGAAATGFADSERRIAMTPEHRMPAGSVGKTFVGATALAMAAEGLLSLDDPASAWLGTEPWFTHLANHDTMNLRQLLCHTSGLIDHVLDPAWRRAARAKRHGPDADPDAYFTPRELVSYVLDQPARFAAGDGYHYTDTGFIVAGLILEAAAGADFYVEAQRRFLDPLGLSRTEAQLGRRYDRLAAGYLGGDDTFALPDKVADQGLITFNPRTEWTGGGYVSNPQDLARWAKLLYEGQAIAAPYQGEMFGSGYRGAGARDTYGIAVFLLDHQVGRLVGHGGRFPGWRSSMYYHASSRIAVAFQVNQYAPDVRDILLGELFRVLLDIAP